MKARGLILLVILAIAGAAAYLYLRPQEETPAASTKYTSKHGSAITVNAPTAGAEVSSPLRVSGVVPGPWSFEANFPVEILDADRKQVAESFATVQGDWMTMDPVEFTAEITFEEPASGSGFLVIHKANPSDDEATADSIEIPIKVGPD